MILAHLIQAASNLPTDASALESSISALERAISALESDIKTRESSSVPWEYSVWVFTFLVVVGVAMELWVIRHEYRDDMEAWALSHFGLLRSPGKPSKTKWRMEVGSVLLITIGVMGELGAGIKITSINGVLRGKSAELRTKNAELRSKSNQLVALINERAKELEQQAEDEALARAELEAEFVKEEPRFTLLRWRRAYITSKLRRFSGQRFTTLNESLHTGTEATLASSELMGMLESEAKWINNIPHTVWGPANISGVGLVVRILPTATAETRRAASTLSKTLNEVLISGVLFADNGQDVQRILPTTLFDEQTVLIEVGEHPTPLSPPHAKEDARKIRMPSK